MSTSDTDGALKSGARTSLVYLIVSIFCALFGGVYEQFSHGVYSNAMLYAFLFPLVGGALPYLILGLVGRLPGWPEALIYHCGIATLTVGSIVSGVLEIYGTTNALTACYGSVGSALWAGGTLIWLGKLLFLKK